MLGFIFLFFPVLVIVAYSFNTGRLLQSFRGLRTRRLRRSALGNSAITASVTVSLYVAVVLRAGRPLCSARSPASPWPAEPAQAWIGWLTALLGLVLVTPEIVNGVSLLPWFVTLGIDLGVRSAEQRHRPPDHRQHSLFSSAVVTFIVRARMAGLSESLEEAAADLGAPPVRRFLDITFPLMRPAVIAGALLAFTLSLDNTVLSSFVSTADATPWPVYVFSSIRSTLRPSIAAMSTLMLLLTLVALALVALILSRARKVTGEGGGLAATLAGGA